MHLRQFQTQAEAQLAIVEYVERFYNPLRGCQNWPVSVADKECQRA